MGTGQTGGQEGEREGGRARGRKGEVEKGRKKMRVISPLCKIVLRS